MNTSKTSIDGNYEEGLFQGRLENEACNESWMSMTSTVVHISCHCMSYVKVADMYDSGLRQSEVAVAYVYDIYLHHMYNNSRHLTEVAVVKRGSHHKRNEGSCRTLVVTLSVTG